MTPFVRCATPADAQRCERLEAEARNNNAGARGAEAFFAEQPIGFLVGADAGFSLVAEIDDVIVGYITVLLTQVLGDRIATVARVYVTARARRVGVGDALIAFAKNTAREQKCNRIDALALPGDRDTKNLYERNGITARLIVATTKL